MLDKIIFLLLSLSFSLVACKTSESKKIDLLDRNSLVKGTQIKELEIIKITHSTWDRESTVIISHESELILKEMPDIKDYLFKDTLTISMEAMRYIEDYIDKNQKDSAKGNLDGRQCFLKVGLKGKGQNVDFYMQPKTDNHFVERLIDTIQKSNYQKECIRLVSILREFDSLSKGKGK